MCFWSHSDSFSDKVYKTKVLGHLPSSKVAQVLTRTSILLTLPWPSNTYYNYPIKNIKKRFIHNKAIIHIHISEQLEETKP